ncbi:MAG: flagellar basal-body MS-ring/collar protein FliF [Albidovulum sp.]
MQQLINVWQALDPRKRLIVAVATIAMFATVYGVTNLATRPSMALLYAGIDGARAGELLTALDQRGVKYEVRGQAVYVESNGRDQLRMDLASQGLPANSGSGYELLDSLSGFGTTSQMFDAAYWRAKEGELARTIAALPNVRSVRVHISNAEPQGFRVASAPKASVAVITRDGTISPAHAKALKFLVSAAVAGMTPSDVAIIDGAGGLVQGDDENGNRAGNDRAADLRQSVTRILEARVGFGKAMVEVAVDTVTESEAISERRIDPEGRVAISSQTDEQTSSSNDSGSSAVTVASNLPAGNAAGGGKSSQSNDTQTTERVNYEVSETTREVVKTPGAVRRITVAVLVDGVQTTDDSGQPQWQPRPDEELTALRDLVAASVGFDETRGDVITIRSMAFEPVVISGTEASASLLSAFPINAMLLVQLAVLAIVSLVLGLFVLRPILTSQPARAGALPAPRGDQAPALNGVIEDGDFVPRDMSVVNGAGANRAISDAQEVNDPVARLRRLISERQDESVEILRSWMDDAEEEKA